MASENLFKKVKDFIQKVRFCEPKFFEDKDNQPNELIFGWLKIIKSLLVKSKAAKGSISVIPESEQ